MASDAVCRVVTSATLIRLITSYQRGVPLGLFLFWSAHAENNTIPSTDRHSTFAKRLDLLPEFIAQHGDAHLLNLLPRITVSFPQRRWSRVCRQAAKKNDTAMLQWAIDRGYLHAADVLIVVVSLESGNSEALAVMEKQQDLLAAIAPRSLTSRMYPKLKDAAVIQWLQAHVPQLEWDWDIVVKRAAMHGRVDVLRYAYACAESTQWHCARLVQRSPPTPEFGVGLRYLLHHHGSVMTGPRLSHILLTVPVKVLKILRDAKCVDDTVMWAAQLAIMWNSVDVLRRFEAVGWISKDKRVDLDAPDVTDAMLYMLEHRLANVTGAAMDCAASKKRWDIVHYIHGHYSVRCTTATMDAAAEQGRLDEVVFLHEHRTECCSSKALDHAALQGNLTLVRYLSEVVHAPGSTDAMDSAAANGHLEVVKYLHTHRTGGCTSDAVRKSLKRGHFRHAVVQYLFTHYRHVFDATVLEALLVHEEFEIWETLREQYPEEAQKSIVSAINTATSEFSLRTIRYVVHTLGRSDLACATMESAPRRRILPWVVAVWRVTGPQSCTMAAVRSVVDHGYCGLHSIPIWILFIYLSGFWTIILLVFKYADPCCGDAAQFVIDHCVEPDAKEQAIQYARDKGKYWMVEKLQTGWTTTPADSIKLHPWLVDPRTPSWVIPILCRFGWDEDRDIGLSYEDVRSSTWPVKAAYRRDCTVLAIALEASRSSNTATDPELSFVGARAAAVRIGHLPTLQWLFEHVDLSVEPTLLDEALFYHRYEVALWLASHCPEACTAVQPPRTKSPFYRDCGYDWSLRQWLESDEGESVRSLVDAVSLPWEPSTHGTR